MTTTARLAGYALTAAALLLSGCGTPPNPAAPPAPASSAAQPARPVVVDVDVAGGQVRTGTQRVEVPVGAQVVYQVRSDQHDELHVHGYDKSAPLNPGAVATVEFTAAQPGVFEVELHHSGLSLPSLQVR